MMARREGTFTETGLNGDRQLFGFVEIPGAKAHLAVGVDESAVLGKANRAAWLELAQFGAIVGLVLLAIWLGSERLIVRPIRAFARTAAQVGRGERDPRAARRQWSAEFMPLAAAIDDMAAKLAARERELSQMNGHLLKLAQVDSLTELANRRTFDTRLIAEWYTAEYLKRPIALLMIDVDYFKAFNDLYGHRQGDECLRAVCRVLSGMCRSDSDLAARYGGEEFVLLLPGAGIEGAVQVAHRLCQAIDALGMSNDGSPLGHVTISIGVASMQAADGAPAQALIEAADAALYRAKQGGRNQVVAHGPDPVTNTLAVA